MPQPINIVFDGPPSAESGRFVEVELDDRTGVNAGEWVERPDGLWALRITALPHSPDDNLCLWLTPEAIRQAFCDYTESPVDDMTDDQLTEVGWFIVDSIYDEYRRLLDLGIAEVKSEATT